MLIDYIAFSYVLYRLGGPLVRSLPAPRKFEEHLVRRRLQSNVSVHLRHAILDFLLVGAACLVAWRHADLGLLWLACGLLLIGIAPVPLPQRPPAPSEDQLDRLALKRRRICVLQLMLVLAWCYSWRRLAV